MFDIGWSEMFLVMAVTVLVMGPEEIPKIMMTLGRVMRRLHYVRFALSQQFDAMMKEAGIDPDDLNMNVNFEAKKDHDRAFDEAAEDEDMMFSSLTPLRGDLAMRDLSNPGLQKDGPEDPSAAPRDDAVGIK